jgi:hypothetical protein
MYRSQNTNTVSKTNLASRARTLKPSYLKSHTAGFPARYTETLRSFYADSSSCSSLTFQIDAVIAMNGAWSPLTGGTPPRWQPTAFAKLVGVYTKVFVKSAKITVVVTTNPTSYNTNPTIHGVTISTNSASLSSLQNATQAGLASFKQMGISPDTCTFTLTLDIGKFFSVDDLLDNPLYSSNSGSNPQILVYAQVWSYNNSTNTQYYSYTVQTDYNVICSDPLPLT